MARLHESLLNSSLAASAGDTADDLQKEAQDSALGKAIGSEKAAKKRAQDELQQVLKQLQQLEMNAQKEAEKAAQKEAEKAAQKEAEKDSQKEAEKAVPNPFAVKPAAPTPSHAVPNPFATTPAPTTAMSTLSGETASATAADAPPSKKAHPSSLGLGQSTFPAASPATTQAPVTASKEGPEDRYRKAMAKLEKAEKDLEAFKKDPAHKDFRMQVKKLFNTKVGQISATWGKIQECTTSLLKAMEEYAKDPASGRLQFAEQALAVRLADDAEVGVRSQPKAAWPMAEVACRVFEQYPGVEELFTGLMCRNCQYLRPDYSGSQVGRTGLAAGQRDHEAFTEFADRMVSYHRLWLAVVVIQGDLAVLWHWFARTLNEPACPISAPMVHAALEAVGADAQARYGKQFNKLVEYIEKEYMAELQLLQQKTKGEEADRLRASHSRLRKWLEGFRSTGRAMPPDGRFVQAREESELNPNI